MNLRGLSYITLGWRSMKTHVKGKNTDSGFGDYRKRWKNPSGAQELLDASTFHNFIQVSKNFI